jgi:hypothetical protein
MMSGMKSMWKDDDHSSSSGDDKRRDKAKEKGDRDREQATSSSISSDNQSNNLENIEHDVADRLLARRPATQIDTDGESGLSVLDLKHADNLVQHVVLLGTPSSTSVR